MELTVLYVKSFVESLVDAHGWHFSIGKILATAIVKWSLLNPLHVVPVGVDPSIYTASIIATMTSYESSNRIDVIGDNHHSFCAMQVSRFYGYKSSDVLKDADKCIEVGLKILHESEDICPTHPLAQYAQGNCIAKAGIDISDKRVALATSNLLLLTGDSQ